MTSLDFYAIMSQVITIVADNAQSPINPLSVSGEYLSPLIPYIKTIYMKSTSRRRRQRDTKL